MSRHHRLEAARGSRTEVESPAVMYLSLRHPPPHPQTSTPSIFSHLSLGCETDKAWTSRLLAVRSLANGMKRCWRINPPKISCQRGRSTLSPCPRVRHFLDPACNPIGGVHLRRPGTTFQVDCLSKYTCVFLFCFLSYMYFAKKWRLPIFSEYAWKVFLQGATICPLMTDCQLLCASPKSWVILPNLRWVAMHLLILLYILELYSPIIILISYFELIKSVCSTDEKIWK